MGLGLNKTTPTRLSRKKKTPSTTIYSGSIE